MHQLQLVSPPLFFFFQLSSKVLVFISLFAFFKFYSGLSWNRKVHYSAGSLFCWVSLGLVVWPIIRWCICILKFQRILCVSFSRMDSGLCIYHWFVWLNLNFSENSQWITLPTQCCLVLYALCANLQHSLIMWLIVSSLSQRNQLLLLLLLLLLLFYSFRVFSISLSWWSVTGVCVTANLPGFHDSSQYSGRS